MIRNTAPLQIKKINKLQNDDNKKNTPAVQYSIKQSVFNPDKFSPPNQWNIRLLNRISRFNTTLECKAPMIIASNS